MSSPPISAPVDARLLPFTLRRWAASGDLRGALAAATMTLVTAVSYAALAGAPLGPALGAAAVLSGLIGATLGGATAAFTGAVPGLVFSPRASVAVVIAAATVHIHTQISMQLQSAATTNQLSSVGSTAITVACLMACLLMAALLQWGFGALKLGGLIRLVPHSVTAGFTVGIGLEIAWSQLPHLFNPGGGPAPPLPALTGVAPLAPLTVGLATMAAVCWAHWRGHSAWALPAGVLAGVLMGLAVQAPSESSGLGSAGLVLPHLQAINLQASPLFSLRDLVSMPGASMTQLPGVLPGLLPSMLGFAFAIAFVNAIETLTATVVIEDLVQHRFDANRALVAGALGSLASVCAGGLPVAGGAAASVVSIQAGARSRQAAWMSAAMVTVLALVSSQALTAVPLAAVAGLMLTVAVALVQAPLKELMAGPWEDRAVAALVCGLLLCSGSVTAVIGGVMAAAALLVGQMRQTLVRRQYDASRPEAVAQLGFSVAPHVAKCIQVIEVGQPLFFATAEALVQVLEKLPRGTRFAILDIAQVSAIDATALRLLARCAATLQLHHRELLLVQGSRQPALVLMGADDMICDTFTELAHALRFAAHRCQLQPPSLPEPTMPTMSEHFADREAFLRLTPPQTSTKTSTQTLEGSLPQTQTQAQAQASPSPSPSPSPPIPAQGHALSIASPLGVSLAHEVLAQAVRELSVYLGPISKLLVKRAQGKAVDREHLYHLLARQLGTVDEREAFLAVAQVSALGPEEAAR
jgi:sulfate permease, SulP family